MKMKLLWQRRAHRAGIILIRAQPPEINNSLLRRAFRHVDHPRKLFAFDVVQLSAQGAFIGLQQIGGGIFGGWI